MNAKISDIEMALGNIQREVDDFHPHLLEFLGKLEGVTNVEYTHGPNEWGADFVLTKQESLTGKTVYVGVIVKNTKINQTVVDEVNRQISECAKIKRKIGNGMHRVRMNEVWVIANGTISENAKEKIHESYHTGVTFTDRKELAGLMAENGYNFSGDLPTNISICLSKQLGFAENLKNQSIGLGISDAGDIFMHQGVIKAQSAQYVSKKQSMRKIKLDEIPIKTAINRHPFLILRGEAGCGKSKMLQNVLSDFANEKEYKKTKMIPIFTTCSDMLSKYEKSIDRLIECFAEEHNLKNLESEFCYMIIIDGIDECGLHIDERFEIMKQWKSESSQVKIKKVIFSTRDYVEDKTLDIPVYRVSDLSIIEIVKVIKKNLSSLDTVNRIVEDIIHSDIFQSLPKNPLATVILINILRDENARHELPSNLTDLFAKYTECSLGRWDVHTREGVKQKEYEAADKILTRIAVHMLDAGVAQINENEARNFFKTYLKDRNLGISHDELFEKTTVHSNLLDVYDGVFRFRHRTIAEFFYSKSFSDDRINTMINKIGENIFDTHWATILFFYVGMQKDCPDLLQRINSIKPQSEPGKILKAINMANILLAGYATPYSHIQEILRSVFIDTSQYLEDIFNRKITDSTLGKLSTMSVLLFFRIMMDYEYSRPFFKQAIEDSLIEIEQLDVHDNVRATSLFLLNLAYASLDGENIFTDMINKLGNRIPAHIKLAIDHETDIMENVGGDIKKFKRTVKRQLLSERRIDKVEYLYNKQIRYLPALKNENQ